MKKFLPIAIIFVVVAVFVNAPHAVTVADTTTPITARDVAQSDAIIADAYANHRNNLQVYGQGIVTALLPDDNTGSKHQRFIITLASGPTLLIVHNIDIAPRVDSLHAGDTVAFYGEYEWNEKGGLIHWTHRDPAGSHVAGWIAHNDQRYQ